MKSVATLLASAAVATALTIAEINGNKFLSPYNGQNVTDVKGLVTAIGTNGIFLRSTEPDEDPATSEGLFVFSTPIRGQVKVGDIITLNGRVTEYRSNALYPYLTQIGTPTNVVVVSSGNEVVPLVVGEDTLSPPTEEFSALDNGDIFGVPNDVSRTSAVNAELDPTKYGNDFWESLVGELVTLKDVVQVSRPNQYGDAWVRGNWAATGVNSHGGLTMLDGDSNPEAIIIGTPTDGSKNPDDTRMGDFLGDITGVVYQAFGFYRVLPLTGVSPIRNATTEHPPVSFESDGTCRAITIANYNARNLDPKSPYMEGIATQIVEKMLTPDLIFLQEVQDDSGATNDGVVAGNVTLTTLATLIEELSGVVYDFAEVIPENNKDGGAPGGNIRVAYIYRPDVIELYNPKQGSATDANEVLEGPELKFNPGRIAPASGAWTESRKPLAAAWKPVKGNGKPFFTVNVHQTSKGGSSTVHGDPRPPVNNGVEKRVEQATLTGDFIAQILEKDPSAAIIAAGDFNEFVQVAPIKAFEETSGLLDLDDVTDMPVEERYTYLFDMNSQALDHMFVSPSVTRNAKYEHLHLNTWQNYDDQVSDHDPSVARLNVCGCGGSRKSKL